MNKLLKKVLVLTLMIAMVFTVAACGGDTTDDGGEGNADVVTYKAATEATFPPFDTIDEETGDIIGFDMDLMNAIGEDQGFKVEYTNIAFDALIPSLQNGDFDMITAGMNAMDPDRQAKVDFSNTYYDSKLVVVVSEDNNDINGVDDLTADMKVTAQIGTTGADEAEALATDAKIGEAVILDEYSACILQVINGDAAACIVDKPVAEAYIKKQGGVKIVGDEMGAESYGFAVQKGNTELLDKINTGLQNMIDNGTYDELVAKWF